jgi:hypothetical protein
MHFDVVDTPLDSAHRGVVCVRFGRHWEFEKKGCIEQRSP